MSLDSSTRSICKLPPGVSTSRIRSRFSHPVNASMPSDSKQALPTSVTSRGNFISISLSGSRVQTIHYFLYSVDPGDGGQAFMRPRPPLPPSSGRPGRTAINVPTPGCEAKSRRPPALILSESHHNPLRARQLCSSHFPRFLRFVLEAHPETDHNGRPAILRTTGRATRRGRLGIEGSRTVTRRPTCLPNEQDVAVELQSVKCAE